jgi:hypothetical protein
MSEQNGYQRSFIEAACTALSRFIGAADGHRRYLSVPYLAYTRSMLTLHRRVPRILDQIPDTPNVWQLQ